MDMGQTQLTMPEVPLKNNIIKDLKTLLQAVSP